MREKTMSVMMMITWKALKEQLTPAAKMKMVSKQARAINRRWKLSLSPGLERTDRVNTFPGGGEVSGGYNDVVVLVTNETKDTKYRDGDTIEVKLLKIFWVHRQVE